MEEVSKVAEDIAVVKGLQSLPLERLEGEITELAAHHVRHWCKGGTTCLANGMLLCSFHHAVHEGGYRIEPSAGPGTRWVFFRPDGTVVPGVPPPLPATGASAVAAQNRQLGLDIGPHTALPYWAGERLDLGLALDALFRAEEVRPPHATGAGLEVGAG